MTRTERELTDPDEALMSRSALGDRPAFELLCRRHLPRLYVLALRLCVDPASAEEVAQEAMFRAWRSAAQFDPARGKLSSWLNRIAINLSIDRRRTEAPLAALPSDLPGSEPDPLQALEARVRSRRVAAGLAALPSRQRVAMLLTYAEDRAGKDVARTLGVSVRALEGLLRRGRLSLKAWLLAGEV